MFFLSILFNFANFDSLVLCQLALFSLLTKSQVLQVALLHLWPKKISCWIIQREREMKFCCSKSFTVQEEISSQSLELCVCAFPNIYQPSSIIRGSENHEFSFAMQAHRSLDRNSKNRFAKFLI